MTKPYRSPAVESPSVVAALRVYFDLDDRPQIIDVPLGHLTTASVEQARAAGGSRIRIHALDRQGQTLDRVVVR